MPAGFQHHWASTRQDFFFENSKEVLHNVAKEAADRLVSRSRMISWAHAEILLPPSRGRGSGEEQGLVRDRIGP